ncbi:hypothetical protein CJ030_MR7G024230 [Morella rubra]|uniref:Pectinesterase inhibitor domain-containing protein n=1 Tax=Morella rubra TaxID=262757 RepID=A0A6A1UUH6_9ROSI|nr:hypothetical protein CJ030_MR8G022750 [Morella rubra]KAB1207868.1 hypothetical protein CJ030_MR7G024230 [Morella rubra]
MAMKHYTSFSLVFLATITGLLAGGADAGEHSDNTKDLCHRADFQPLCRSVVKGLNEPHAALESAINQLISHSHRAKGLAGRHGKSQNVDVCKENFDDAIFNLKTSLKNLKTRDLDSLNTNLSAALSDYVTCDDAFTESSQNNPIGDTDTLLRHMASNCLYLSSLLK